MRPFDRRLVRHARATSVALAVDVALGLGIAALAVAEAWLLGSSIADAFLGGRSMVDLGPRLGALAVVFVARAAAGWAQEAAAYRIAAAIKSELRRELLAHAVTLGPRWASTSRNGEIVQLATRGLDALDTYFARYLPQLALAAIAPVVVVAMLLAVDLSSAVTVAVTVPLIPVFMVLVGRYSERQRGRRWNALSRLASYFLDVVAGLPTLRVFGRASGQHAAIRRMTDEYRRETIATLRVAFLSAFVLELIATLSVALVAVGVGLRLVDGGLSLSTGLFVLILAPEAYLPLRQLGTQFHASEEGLSAAARVFDVLEAEPAAAGGTLAPPSLRGGELRLEAVSVVHPDRGEVAPDRVSLNVRAGEVLALRGPSGAGKSTVLATILGLVPVDEGRVIVTGRDGEELEVVRLDGAAWRARIGWVPQEPFLVAGTVRDNIRLVARDASDDAIREALDRLGLAGLALDQRLGERGGGLSSGQRRRVAVARALLRPIELLLLDEPTAGLDDESERLVLDAVRDAAERRGIAVILVAHRPAALAAADRSVAVRARDAESAPTSAPVAGTPVVPAAAAVGAGRV